MAISRHALELKLKRFTRGVGFKVSNNEKDLNTEAKLLTEEVIRLQDLLWQIRDNLRYPANTAGALRLISDEIGEVL